MKVLAINCGSSTLKFQLFEAEAEGTGSARVQRLAGGMVDRIGGRATIEFAAENGQQLRKETDVVDHHEATRRVLDWLGALQPLNTGERTAGLGFVNEGGTLSVPGMLHVNRCSWGHVLAEAARLLGLPLNDLLTSEELAALEGRASPEGVIV